MWRKDRGRNTGNKEEDWEMGYNFKWTFTDIKDLCNKSNQYMHWKCKCTCLTGADTQRATTVPAGEREIERARSLTEPSFSSENSPRTSAAELRLNEDISERSCVTRPPVSQCLCSLWAVSSLPRWLGGWLCIMHGPQVPVHVTGSHQPHWGKRPRGFRQTATDRGSVH